MNVAIFVGARPGYIKTWPVYQAFAKRGIRPIVLATGQHHDILKQQQDVLPMPIDEWLLKRQPSVPLYQLYGQIYDAACEYLSDQSPDAVFVNGDTSSALACAMAAFHLQIPIAHIESGLRSGDLSSPYPEEFNRIAIDGMSTWLFAPTEHAAEICRAVNPGGKVCVTGNTVIDALKEGLSQLDLQQRHTDLLAPYILLDMHRRETDGNGMDQIAEVVIEQAAEHGLHVYWPAHPSPKVQAVALSFLRIRYPNFKMLPPLDYLDFIAHMQGAQLILTDSGGVVEEAITIGTPTLQLRDHTDRQEAVDRMFSWLATTDPVEVGRLLKIAIPYAADWKGHIACMKNPYGNGDAGERSVAFFLGE